MRRAKPQTRERWVLVPTKDDTPNFTYYFSDEGILKSEHKVTGQERILKGSTDQYGFLKLNLKLIEGKRQSFYVHRLVAEEFLSPPTDESKKYIIHVDGNKKNNYFKNLRWVDRDELTSYHRTREVYNSVTAKGIKRYKLNESKVRLIKQRLAAGRTKKEIIARDFDISLAHLIRIEKGQYCAHVKLEE